MVKALVAPAVLVLIMLVIGGTALVVQQGVNRDMQTVSGNLAPASEIATELLNSVYRERMAATEFLGHRADYMGDLWGTAREEVEANLANARQMIQDPARGEILDRFADQHQRFGDVFRDDVVPAAMEAQNITMRRLQPVVMDVEFIIEDVINALVRAGRLEETRLAGAVASQVAGTQTSVIEYTSTGDSGRFNLAQMRYGNAETSLQQLSAAVTDRNIAGDIAELVQLWQDYGEAMNDLSAAVTQTSLLVREELNVIGPAMIDLVREFQQSAIGDLNTVAGAVTQTGAQAQVVILALVVAGLLIGAVVAWVLTRGYVKPLVRTNAFLGDLVDDMDAGNGDLTRRVEVTTRDEVGELGGNINRFVETLQKVIGTINSETSQLASAAEELSAVTNQTNQGTARQRGETEQVAAAINQMTATVQEIARNATDASTAAEEANQSAADGRRVVVQTVEAINALVEAVEKGQRTVDQVGNEAENITEVVDVIQAVAEQTNLLALNAAIEAARAGEEGRGFAVVASEVRDLAKKTQDSTVKIQELIEKLQKGTRGAIGVMRESGEQGQKTVEHAAAAGSALERIEEQVRIINDMNAQIASAAEEQSAVTNDISGSVETIRGVSDETAQAADQTSSSSEELAKLAERLSALVKQFRI